MPNFKFRLLAALRLAERNYEDAQRLLGAELRKLGNLQKRHSEQEHSWQSALEGQKDAGIASPQELGLWQRFAQHQLNILRSLKQEIIVQEQAVLKQRDFLRIAHQEVEKLVRLRDKQKEEFDRMELQKEQAVLDEAGQVVFSKNKSKNNNLRGI